MGRKRKTDKKRTSDAQVAEKPKEPSKDVKPIIGFRTGLKILCLLSAGVLVLVWISAPEEASWISNLIISLIIMASIWLVAAFSYTISRWLRNR